MTTRYQKAKAWASTHAEEITLVGIVAAYAAGVVLLWKSGTKMVEEAEQKLAEERKEIQDAVNRGCSVLPNPDGSYWIIEPRTA